MLAMLAGCAKMNKPEPSAPFDAGATVRGVIAQAAFGGAEGAGVGHQMDAQAAELAHDLPGTTVQRIGEGIAVTFPDGLLFRSGSYRLTPAARDNLRRVAASLQKYSNTRTMIVTHTGSHGDAVDNMNLSIRRALSAASFISGAGVDRGRICAVGRGATEQNRRVEIAIFAGAAPSTASRN